MLLVSVAAGGGGGRWEKGWSTRAVFYRRIHPLSDGTNADKGLVLSTRSPKGFSSWGFPELLRVPTS